MYLETGWRYHGEDPLITGLPLVYSIEISKFIDTLSAITMILPKVAVLQWIFKLFRLRHFWLYCTVADTVMYVRGTPGYWPGS